jgi:hypothetical protein
MGFTQYARVCASMVVSRVGVMERLESPWKVKKGHKSKIISFYVGDDIVTLSNKGSIFYLTSRMTTLVVFSLYIYRRIWYPSIYITDIHIHQYNIQTHTII